VITASVTATLVEASRRRFIESEVGSGMRFDELSERLAKIEAALERAAATGGRDRPT
jgi:hypothetical protein